MIKDLTGGTDKCQIETNWGSWSQVCWSKPHVADFGIARYLEEDDVCHCDLVEEMRVGRLSVDRQHPAVLVTSKPDSDSQVDIIRR